MRSAGRILFSMALIFLLTQCRDDASEKRNLLPRPAPPEWKAPSKPLSYHLEAVKKWLKTGKDSLSKQELDLVLALNRIDREHLVSSDSLILPNDYSGDRVYYLPFPLKADFLKDISKIIFFSYPSQSFGAYEYGYLVYAGPSSMGSKKNPTPAGLYFTNWKAEQTTSTFNDEWDLRWNFNIQNREGIGWHQYALPGYPASHSCLRLLEKDARHLYRWADEWKLKNKDSVLLKGTPVVVFGDYTFDGPKPWRAMAGNAKLLDISPADLKRLTKPYLEEIIKAQEKREIANAKTSG